MGFLANQKQTKTVELEDILSEEEQVQNYNQPKIKAYPAVLKIDTELLDCLKALKAIGKIKSSKEFLKEYVYDFVDKELTSEEKMIFEYVKAGYDKQEAEKWEKKKKD